MNFGEFKKMLTLAGIGSASSSGSGKWVAGTVHEGFIATRAHVLGDQIAGSQFNSRSLHYARAPVTTLGIDLANWIVTPSHPPLGEHPMGADCTVTASVEYPAGTVTHFTFGGEESTTLYDGSTLASDPLPINIPVGTGVFITIHGTYPGTGADGAMVPICASSNFGNGGIDIAAGEAFEYGDGLTDRTGTAGTFASTTAGIFYRPVAVWGSLNTPSYALIGDSRVVGYMDDCTTSPYQDMGELERSVGPVRGYGNFAYTGEMLTEILGLTPLGNGSTTVAPQWCFGMRASVIRKRATHIMSNYGVNDLMSATEGLSHQTMVAWKDMLRNQFPNHWFYDVTIPAETVAGQPATLYPPYPANLINEMNNYLLSGFANNDGTYDIASFLQAPRNSGIWANTDWVSVDGIHESPSGCAALAASGIIQVV